jgi:ribonuclease HI
MERVVTPDKKAEKEFQAILQSATDKDRIEAYTDGACPDNGHTGPMGIGVVIVFRNYKYSLGQYYGKGTSNRAELYAILTALTTIYYDLPVSIYTDSKYAIGVATRSDHARANMTILQRLWLAMGRFSDLRFEWVKGHSGVRYNEEADRLATSCAVAKDSTARLTLIGDEEARPKKELTLPGGVKLKVYAQSIKVGDKLLWFQREVSQTDIDFVKGIYEKGYELGKSKDTTADGRLGRRIDF